MKTEHQHEAEKHPDQLSSQAGLSCRLATGFGDCVGRCQETLMTPMLLPQFSSCCIPPQHPFSSPNFPAKPWFYLRGNIPEQTTTFLHFQCRLEETQWERSRRHCVRLLGGSVKGLTLGGGLHHPEADPETRNPVPVVYYGRWTQDHLVTKWGRK